MSDGLSGMSSALARVGTRREAFDVLASHLRARGFVDLIFTVESNMVPLKWDEMRWSTLEEKRLSTLDALGFDGHDPIRRFARRASDPFVWTASDNSGLDPNPGRDIVHALREVSIYGGMTVAIWGRAGRIAIIDAFGIPDHILALTPWERETFQLAAAMTFRTIERVSSVRRSPAFTARELEILDLAFQGMTTRLIARRLGIVEPTVKFHLKSVRAKLNARNTPEAVAWFATLDASGPPVLRSGKEIRSSEMQVTREEK
ncbi:LuxR C-terminal-related transcriptional regulator [Erythrobacter aureus]|uniref:helix-turn-helix transcriptional regulator n=1 Tax=Erythrobacter aureus TaxID=2182384 RepID=UPI003A93CD7B